MHRVRISVRENELSDPARVQAHDYEERLTRRGRGWVAETDGRICGFAIVDLEAREVWALFVEPRLEGQGIGRRLQQVMLDWIFAAGVEEVSLGTSVATRAERFYTAAGWRLIQRADGEARFEMRCDQWLSNRGTEAGQTS